MNPVPRLLSQLFESSIFIQIGDRDFQVPRDIFSAPGDSPNFFTLGFGGFFASPQEVFPGLDRTNLLRPPAIIPPCVPHRSGDLFAELLHTLRGYPVHIRDEGHRLQLLKDCKYYHLRGLEQKLIAHDISFNPFSGREEILIRLEDVRQSGLKFVWDDPDAGVDGRKGGRVVYSRPFVDEKSYDLIVQIGGETTAIDINTMTAVFFVLTKARVASLLNVVSNRMNLNPSPPTRTPPDLSTPSGGTTEKQSISSNTPLGGETVKIQIDDETDLVVDGNPVSWASLQAGASQTETSEPPAKRKRTEGDGKRDWIVRDGQWKLRVQRNAAGGGYEIAFVATKLDVCTEQRVRNRGRAWLG
ncbi:domain containing protein [Aspergillus sclerotialis]|uniref:Domain containing protein n=1 Tax=Aspergillus sclerotialis TaxID=2070753 RepID=A0A3A2Z5C6_9EURO|nr:domain containing protein [Aspergillus sclerotialis]